MEVYWLCTISMDMGTSLILFLRQNCASYHTYSYIPTFHLLYKSIFLLLSFTSSKLVMILSHWHLWIWQYFPLSLPLWSSQLYTPLYCEAFAILKITFRLHMLYISTDMWQLTPSLSFVKGEKDNFDIGCVLKL